MELPPWFAWQNRADALGLVMLCHYSEQVRVQALGFLNKITEMYSEFTGVGGGSVYIQKSTIRSSSAKDVARALEKNRSINVMDTILGERTVGGLITKHGRSIARMATMKYEEEHSGIQRNMHLDATRRRGSTFLQQQTANVDFSQCIHQWGLIPICISQLAKRVVNAHLHETILCALDVLLKRVHFMPPHTAHAQHKTGWSSQQVFYSLLWVK